MQVDPIKPTLKAPGSKRLKLEHEKLLSSFAVNFNLRRYTEELRTIIGRAVQVDSIKTRVDSAYGFSA